ncbi:hypothetical protein BJV78DRAFT_642606 [Lactifluus subvellereus]|nr:hypothetical protein BJV78DRAFT_642606 [Lactifluus subvellereus]
MSQLTPYLRYPGGCPAFFTDLHLHFSRWLRLVALVPLVHASVNGISYDDLCSHLLGVFPSSNPSNVLAVSVERIRSAVSEMLLEEPFFVCSFSDSKSSLSTPRWVYEPSLDYDPSRISFAFNILRCINLSPGWAVCDLLSGLTSVTLFPALSISEPNNPESGRQQEPPSGYGIRGHSSPQSASTSVVRVLVSSATIPHASVEPDRPDELKPPPLPGLGSLITPGPPRPHVPLNPPPDSVLVMVGSEVLQENLRPDTACVSHHLSRPYEVPPQHCNTLELSCTNSYVVEDSASDLATDAQYKEHTSDLSVHLGQLQSPFSTGRSDHSCSPYAKIPLFLPSQTPNRDPSPPDILSPQPSSLTLEARSSSKASPMRSRGKLHNNHPCSNPSHTSALQNVDTEIHLNAKEGISSVDSRSLAPCVMASKLPFSLEWPDRFGTNACPRTPSVEPNHGLSRYQSTSYSNSLEERREVSGSGCITHEAIPSGVPPAQRDLGPSETTVRVQNWRTVQRKLIRGSPKAPKRARHPITPVLATILNAPLSTPSPRSRKTRTPSPLTPFNFSDHGGSSGAGEGQTHTFNPSDNNPRIPRPGRSSCTLTSPSSNAPQSDPGQNASLCKTSRPSVIVYKVAMGPNLARSKDVIRVSYGEGHRKRNSMKHLGHGSKRRDLGCHASPLKERDNARRDDAPKHPGRRLLRSNLRVCFGERRASSAGPQGADTKVSGKPQSAERVEGDMAWDFGVGSQTRTRCVDVDRSRVRVGGLTSVRMIPRTAVDGEIGPGVTRLAT